MFRLIPPPLHRSALRLAHGIRRRWWRIARVQLVGCRIFAFDAQGQVLLIRHSYGSGNWMLPGGGLGRGEEPLAAALRELLEETGLALNQARHFAEVEEPLYGTVNRVHLVAGRAEGEVRIDCREVIEARYFPAHALPPDLSPMLALRFADWLEAAQPKE
jgi:8-oxo-dGTP pyrophosphatase MutT (NUDIX family)